MPPDPPSRHASVSMRECAFARYYQPATILFPPPQLKILYATLLLTVGIVLTLSAKLHNIGMGVLPP